MKLTAAEEAEWLVRTSLERDPMEAMADPVWRIANRYQIVTENGEVLRFTPNPEQRVVIWAIFVKGWRRIIIPKARQLGMSTLLAIIALDGVVWREGYKAALIDKTGEDAEKKHREKICFAWDRVDPYEKEALIEAKKNASCLEIREVVAKGQPAPAESLFTAGINYRGGTLEMLWISEWGYIQDVDRPRSREINAGAMPAIEKARDGLCVIETTWKGGLDGEVGAYVTEALSAVDLPPEQQSPKTWRILFFPWYLEPTYAQSHGVIDAVSAAYFREVEAKGVTLTHQQKLWYAEKRRTAISAKSIKEEYPTFQEECWSNVPEGSIYGEQIEQARVESRIGPFLCARDYPVHTFWDIGAPINTVTWCAQITPYEVRLVDVLFDVEMATEQRAAWFRQLPWDFGNHYLPHDAATAIDTEGVTPMQRYQKAFGPSVMIVPMIKDRWFGIADTKTNFPRFKFRADPLYKHDPKYPFPLDPQDAPRRVKIALDWLARYRFIRESSTGVTKNEPLHDKYSHVADALRQLGQTLVAGRVEHANSIGRRDAESRPRQLQVIYARPAY